MGIVKSMLRLLMPRVRCFLDVDNLTSIADLEHYVQQSDLILIFLTKGYINSKNCRRELIASTTANKPLLLMRETDIDTHGGMTLTMLEDEFALLTEAQQLSNAEALAVRHLLSDGLKMIDYHREKVFKYACLIQIAQTIMEQQLGPRGSSDPPRLRIKDQIQVIRCATATRSLYMSVHYRALPSGTGQESIFDVVARHVARFGVRLQSQLMVDTPILLMLCPGAFKKAGLVDEICTLLDPQWRSRVGKEKGTGKIRRRTHDILTQRVRASVSTGKASASRGLAARACCR